jgi:hypothetical protein
MLVLAPGQEYVWGMSTSGPMLAAFCAEVIRSRSLAGCLAPLPANPGARARLFSFLRSLKHAGAGRVGILVPAAQVTAAQLLESAAGGVDQVVILQGGEHAADAMAAVARLFVSGRSPIAVHVWIDTTQAGDLHRTWTAWARELGRYVAVELAPVVFAAANGLYAATSEASADTGSTARDASSEPARVACEWLVSTITVHPSGTILPCPLHAPRNEWSLANRPADLLFAIGALPQTLASHPTCRGCAHRMRFTIPNWMKSTDAPRVRTAEPEPVTERFVDYVQGRLDDVEPAEREALIAALIERARSRDSAAI